VAEGSERDAHSVDEEGQRDDTPGEAIGEAAGGHHDSQPNKPRVIRDSVWGDIDVTDPVLLAIIDHPLVQRLRRIRSLGLGSDAFPSTHLTRFAHVLGTLHLCATYYRLRSDDHSWWRLRADEEGNLVVAPFLAACQALFSDLLTPPFSHSTEPLLFSTGLLGEQWRRDARHLLVFMVACDLIERRGEEAVGAIIPKSLETWSAIWNWCRFVSLHAESAPTDLSAADEGMESLTRLGIDWHSDLLNCWPVWRIPYDPSLLDSIARNAHYAGLGIAADHRTISHMWRLRRTVGVEAEEADERDHENGNVLEILAKWRSQAGRDVRESVLKLLRLVYLEPGARRRSAALMCVVKKDRQLRDAVRRIRRIVSDGYVQTSEGVNGLDQSHTDPRDPLSWRRLVTGDCTWLATLRDAQSRWLAFDDYFMYARVKVLAMSEEGGLSSAARTALGIDGDNALPDDIGELATRYRDYHLNHYRRLLTSQVRTILGDELCSDVIADDEWLRIVGDL